MTHQTTEDIEREIERDRARIDQTIHAIGDRLSPGQLLDQAMGYMRSGGGEMASNLARSVKDNPLPVILTGVGLAWLIAASTTRNGSQGPSPAYDSSTGWRDAAERARSAVAALKREAHETESAFQERVTAARAAALSMKQDAGELADAFRQRVDDYMRRAETAVDNLKDSARHAQTRVEDLYASQPLIAGAIGVAAGALIGALVPPTQVENRTIGAVGDAVRGTAREMASQALERGEALAGEATRAALNAAGEASGRAAREDTAA